MVTASKVSSSKGRAVTSTCTKVMSGRRRRPHIQHAFGEVCCDDVHAGVGEGFGGDLGACGYVQHFLAGVRVYGCDHSLAPVDVLAEGEDAVHEVVAFGYGVSNIAAMSLVFLFRVARVARVFFSAFTLSIVAWRLGDSIVG